MSRTDLFLFSTSLARGDARANRRQSMARRLLLQGSPLRLMGEKAL